MTDIFSSIKGLDGEDSGELKYIDFTKYFKVATRDFSDVKIHADNTETILEIYRKLNGDLPFCKNCHIKNADRIKLYEYLKKVGFKVISSFIPTHSYAKKDSILLLASDGGDFLIAMEEYGDNISARFFYQQDSKAHNKFINDIIEFTKPKGDGLKLSLLLKEYGEIVKSPFITKKQELDFDNYNEDFEAVHKTIIEFLKDDDEPQLAMIFGSAGCGKSRYIKTLSNYTDKEIVYVTKDMIDIFCMPDFLGFATRELKKCVLICEDIDGAIINHGERTTATSNLLNLSSGCLADILQTKIVCTYNCSESEIDKSLLRKGRLRIKYQMLPLETSRANRLFKKLGKKHITEEPMVLADIYNFEIDNQAGLDSNNKKKVGF